jgi:hypothetical protein
MRAHKLAAFSDPQHVRKVVSFRDARQRIIVPRGTWCQLCLRSCDELIKGGYAVLIDSRGGYDFILLTRSGVALCEGSTGRRDRHRRRCRPK